MVSSRVERTRELVRVVKPGMTPPPESLTNVDQMRFFCSMPTLPDLIGWVEQISPCLN